MISRVVRFLTIVIVMAMPVASLAGVTVGADQKSVVHKSSNGVTITFPDVCKTPGSKGPIPIPYPNIAGSSDTSQASKSTKRKGSTVELAPKNTPRQSVLAGPKTMSRASVASYSLDVSAGGKLDIQQTAGDNSVTTATYVDGEGKKLSLREPTLIELANGELCGVCATKRGNVTAVYRLLPKTLKRKRN